MKFQLNHTKIISLSTSPTAKFSSMFHNIELMIIKILIRKPIRKTIKLVVMTFYQGEFNARNFEAQCSFLYFTRNRTFVSTKHKLGNILLANCEMKKKLLHPSILTKGNPTSNISNWSFFLHSLP